MAILIPRLRRYFASRSIVWISNPHRNVHAFHRFHFRHRCTRCDSRYGNSPPQREIYFKFESTVPVKGCSDDDKTLRCDEGNGNTAWQNTETCMKKLGNKDCYCWGAALYFAIVNDNYPDFALCCKEVSQSSTTYYCGPWSIDKELRWGGNLYLHWFYEIANMLGLMFPSVFLWYM